MKTNSNQSSLSRYGYDMVVAVTQASVNSVMKEFMSRYEQKEYLLVLQRNFNVETETYTYISLDPVQLGIMDKVSMLLETPTKKTDRTAEEIINYQELYRDNKVSYVCKAQLGINPEAADKAPNIIQLDKSDIDSKFNATFNPIFKEFNMIRLYSEDERVLMQKEEQPEDEIWKFAYNIKLNYQRDIPEANLPEQIKQELKKYVPTEFSNLFDIRALYADFTTAMIKQYSPHLEEDPAVKEMVQVFFNDFVLKDLREHAEKAIFSYSIKPETDILQKLEKALVIPAAYKYFVSPYIDDEGEEQTDMKNLYTINYIVMEKDMKFPELKPLSWNWVSSGEEDKKHGCMAVNSVNLIRSLEKDLKEITCGAYLVPNVDLSDKFVKIDIKTSYSKSDCPAELSFVAGDNKKQYVLSYTNMSEDKVHASAAFGIAVGVKIRYELKMTINIKESNQIEIEIKNEAFIELQTGASHSKGRMVGDIFNCLLELVTDAGGNLSVNKTLTHNHLDEDIDHNFFVDVFCMGTDRACINSISEFTEEIEKTIETGLETKIGQVFNSNIHWVLPGGNTFIFNNPILSEGNDLVADLTYAANFE